MKKPLKIDVEMEGSDVESGLSVEETSRNEKGDLSSEGKNRGRVVTITFILTRNRDARTGG